MPRKELDLSIDKLSLDQEWVEQPTLYFEWAKEAADAQHVLDQEKAKLESVEAELETAIREQPDDYGINKATESAIKTAVILQPEYKAAVSKVNSAKHDLAIAQATVNALEHRKRALSLLVELWIREYYSSDSAPRPRSIEAGEMEKAAVRGRARRRLEERDQEDDG